MAGCVFWSCSSLSRYEVGLGPFRGRRVWRPVLAFVVKEDYALRLLTSNLTEDITQTAHIFFSTPCSLIEIGPDFPQASLPRPTVVACQSACQQITGAHNPTTKSIGARSIPIEDSRISQNSSASCPSALVTSVEIRTTRRRRQARCLAARPRPLGACLAIRNSNSNRPTMRSRASSVPQRRSLSSPRLAVSLAARRRTLAQVCSAQPSKTSRTPAEVSSHSPSNSRRI